MKRKISILLAALLLLTCFPTVIAAANSPFTDVVPGSWYEEAVLWASESNVTSGVGNGLFGPNLIVTRAQVVTMLWRLEKEPGSATASPFSDIPAGKWYADAVAWAAEKQIVAGYPDGTFAPGRDISRQELVTILHRYAKYKNDPTLNNAGADLSKYSDDGQVASFAREAMQWAVGNGIVNGTSDTTLSPNGAATRAQLVQMLYRWLATPPQDDDELPPIPVG